MESLSGLEDASRHAMRDAELYRRLGQAKSELVASGRALVDLSMINPDLPPPRLLVDKLMEASNKPQYHRYSVSRGTRRLREAFAEKYRQAFAVELNPENEVCVTMGTKEAISSALRVLKGRSVHGTEALAILPAPVYPPHAWAVEEAGFRVAFFPVGAEAAMLDRIGALVENARLAGIKPVLLTNFPHNPTGSLVSKEFWKQTVALMQRAEGVVLNDFVYGELSWHAERASSVLGCGCSDGLLETYSLSKAYAIPGWRIGAIVGDARFIKPISEYKSRVDYGVFTPLQLAAAAALEQPVDFISGLRDSYRRRLSILQRSLRSVGFDAPMPAAGLSLWARLPERFQATGALQFSERLLVEEGIATLPGDLFVRTDSDGSGKGFVRFAIAASEAQLAGVASAVERLQA